MSASDVQEFIALDVGTKRTGMARGNSLACLAEPLKTLPTDEVLDELKKLDIDGVVVGLPRNLSGDDTAQTEWVRQWAAVAQPKIAVPFYWQDEALTSVSADPSLDVDAQAAATILQDFLDTPEAERVVF